jgi:hypothetical protein
VNLRWSAGVGLFAVVAVTVACRSSEPGVDPALARVRLSSPEWKIVPNSDGAPGATELLLSAIIDNPSDEPLSVSMAFRSFHADGSAHAGCFDDGQGNAGLTEIVQAESRARVTCRTATPPAGRDALSVTVRHTAVAAAMTKAAMNKVRDGGFGVRDVALELNKGASNPVSYGWTATARIHSTLEHDLNAFVRFHFYDKDNIQVGRCQSRPTSIQREVAVRVSCIDAPWIPPGTVPVRVGTDIVTVP